MSDEEVTPSRGLPENPGNGNGPPMDVPPGRDEHPVEEIRDKFESIMDESIGEGCLSVKVTDDKGNEKQRVDYMRVDGKGSIEALKYDDSDGNTLDAENADNSKWAIRRKDKLGHTDK